MFVAHDVLLDVSFGVARPRLVSLTSGRALADASRAAYAEGLAGQPGVAPNSGASAGLARVRFLPPVERRDSITVGLRWETTGEVAGLFPVLDADITLAAAGEHTATLTLSGVYRSPCGQQDHSLARPCSARRSCPGRPGRTRSRPSRPAQWPTSRSAPCSGTPPFTFPD